LQRRLGLGSAIAAVAGESIAVGIFLTPAGMAKSLGSPFWLLMVWLIIAAMTVSGALCFGELASRYPESGGLYVYLREGYGQRVAFLYGWMCLLVMDPGITAAMASGMGTYAGYIFGWGPGTTKAVAIATLLALGALHILNTQLGAGVLRVVTWLKFGVLGAIVLRAVFFHLGSLANFRPFVQQRVGSMPLGPALAIGLVAAFFTFGGWWDVSKIAGEIKDPARTLPRALIAGVLGVTAAYVFISAVFVYLVPLERVTSDQGFVSQAGEVLFGSAGAKLLAIAVVLCVLGSLAVLTMVAPRVYYAMSKDGVFFSKVAVPHPKFGTPWRAIALQVGMASLLLLVGSFGQILSYFMFVAVLFLGLTVATVFRFRRAQPNQPGVVRTFGYPLTPIFFLMIVVLLLAIMLLHNWLQAVVGLAVVLAGWPLYSMIERRGNGEPALRDEAA
jgi:basic amino acid/polyamine antiporter, APA family